MRYLHHSDSTIQSWWCCSVQTFAINQFIFLPLLPSHFPPLWWWHSLQTSATPPFPLFVLISSVVLTACKDASREITLLAWYISHIALFRKVTFVLLNLVSLRPFTFFSRSIESHSPFLLHCQPSCLLPCQLLFCCLVSHCIAALSAVVLLPCQLSYFVLKSWRTTVVEPVSCRHWTCSHWYPWKTLIGEKN